MWIPARCSDATPLAGLGSLLATVLSQELLHLIRRCRTLVGFDSTGRSGETSRLRADRDSDQAVQGGAAQGGVAQPAQWSHDGPDPVPQGRRGDGRGGAAGAHREGFRGIEGSVVLVDRDELEPFVPAVTKEDRARGVRRPHRHRPGVLRDPLLTGCGRSTCSSNRRSIYQGLRAPGGANNSVLPHSANCGRTSIRSPTCCWPGRWPRPARWRSPGS
jgi:hypothetical protein